LGWSARHQVAGEAYALLDAARLPHYRSPMRCMRALAAITHHAEACRRLREQAREPLCEMHVPEAVATLQQARADLSEHRAEKRLAAYGIPATAEALAQSAQQACELATGMGFPVVLKVQSPDVPHKTEAGGVRIGLRDAHEVAQAYEEILQRV